VALTGGGGSTPLRRMKEPAGIGGFFASWIGLDMVRALAQSSLHALASSSSAFFSSSNCTLIASF
jgi:hypothetical protein